MDDGTDNWDDDWAPLDQQQQAMSSGEPAPSGFTTSSRAVSSSRRPSSSNLRQLPRPGTISTPVISGRRASQQPATSSGAPTVSGSGAAAERFGAATTAPAESSGARRVRPRIDLQPRQYQPPRPPPPPAAPTATAQPQQPQPRPRHRTLLNYALDLFNSRLAAWKVFQPDPHRETSAAAAAAAPAPASLSAEELEQLASAVAALQSCLRDGQAAATAPGDRQDLWRLCSVCLEAACGAAHGGGSVPGAVVELSRALQGMGRKLYDMMSEPPAPGGLPVEVAGEAGGGDFSGGGGGGVALLDRVTFFHKMGSSWLDLGLREQAAWHLARAREGLGQLQAEHASVQPSYDVPYRRPAGRARRRDAAHEEDERQGGGQRAATQGVEEEVVAESGGGGDAGNRGGGGSVGPWTRLGVSAAAFLSLEAGVLHESLRLALAESHKAGALRTNLLAQLLVVMAHPAAPPALVTRTATNAVALLTLAAEEALGSVPALQQQQQQQQQQQRQGKGQQLQGQKELQQQPRLRPQQPPSAAAAAAVVQEGLTLLADVLALLDGVLVEGPGGEGRPAPGAAAAAEAAAAVDVDPTGELADSRLQALMMLISGNLRLKNYDGALSYIREYGRYLTVDGATDPSSDELAAPPPGSASLVARRRRRAPAAKMRLEVLLFSLRAYLGLGRVAEAAAVVAHDIQPHPSCTHAVVKAALTLLLEGLPWDHLAAALPRVIDCLMACLEKCKQQAQTAAGPAAGPAAARRQGGDGGVESVAAAAAAAAAWPASSGPELVLQVATAVACYEGPVAEQHLLSLLAHDDVVAAVCYATDPRDRLHRLLFARGAAAYQQSDAATAARLFAAALLYAAGGGGAPYCRTARMLSCCYAAMGQTRLAAGYLDLVEPHEPDTVALLLLRLRLVLRAQAEAAAAACGSRGGEGGGGEGKGGGGGGGGGGKAVGDDDQEALRLVDRLQRCCDFEACHLTVAYDIAIRARRHRVAIAATELAMRCLPPPRGGSGSGGGTADGADATAALVLARNCLVARLRSGPLLLLLRRRRPAASTDEEDEADGGGGGRLSYSTAQAALQDLRWLCGRLKGAALAADAQPTLIWLRDLALRLLYDVLGFGDEETGRGSGSGTASDGGAEGAGAGAEGDVFEIWTQQQHSYGQHRTTAAVAAEAPRRDWRTAAAALSCARQLHSAAAAAPPPPAPPQPPQQAARCAPPAGLLPLDALKPSMVAVAAGMIEAFAASASLCSGAGGGEGSAGDTPPDAAVVVSARKLLLECGSGTSTTAAAADGRQSGPSGQTAAAAAATSGALRAAGVAAVVRGCDLSSGRGGPEGDAAGGWELRSYAVRVSRRKRKSQRWNCGGASGAAMVEDPAVSAAQLEALAELCLAPGRPWRCAPMACGLLGFAMRKALAPPPPLTPPPQRPAAVSSAAAAGEPTGEQREAVASVDIVARAIRRLSQLGSPAVRLRVCERAVEVASRLRQQHRQHQKQRLSGGPDPVASTAAAASPPRYPASELQHLWASCYNAAVAEELSGGGWGGAAAGGAGGRRPPQPQPQGPEAAAAAAAGGMAQRLIAMAVRLAGLSEADDPGSPEVEATAADSELARLLERAFAASLETVLPPSEHTAPETAVAATAVVAVAVVAATGLPPPPPPPGRPPGAAAPLAATAIANAVIAPSPAPNASLELGGAAQGGSGAAVRPSRRPPLPRPRPVTQPVERPVRTSLRLAAMRERWTSGGRHTRPRSAAGASAGAPVGRCQRRLTRRSQLCRSSSQRARMTPHRCHLTAATLPSSAAPRPPSTPCRGRNLGSQRIAGAAQQQVSQRRSSSQEPAAAAASGPDRVPDPTGPAAVGASRCRRRRPSAGGATEPPSCRRPLQRTGCVASPASVPQPKQHRNQNPWPERSSPCRRHRRRQARRRPARSRKRNRVTGHENGRGDGNGGASKRRGLRPSRAPKAATVLDGNKSSSDVAAAAVTATAKATATVTGKRQRPNRRGRRRGGFR
ncbi:hypothetical protein PLESTM_000375000 [Pleodorina starrii]|nr:hypothetical protein PLESTM_000375000 [Pleodorina starrii]